MPRLTVFVPGIMGSSLTARVAGAHGEPKEERIWGAHLPAIVRTLTINPEAFGEGSTGAHEVIRHFRRVVWPQQPVYADILSFCTDPSGLGVLPERLVAFGYDWRRDNLTSAAELAAVCRGHIAMDSEVEFNFIAHSMGGIVVRLMLLDNPSIARRSRAFIQIGSPIKGSARAFITLREKLELHPMLDAVCRLISDDLTKLRLMQQIQSFPSVYQLLPPSEIQILRRDDGTPVSVFDDRTWLPARRDLLARAIEVHGLLATPLAVRTFAVYSGARKTDESYLLDHRLRVIRRRKADGDGTVTCFSAYADIDMERRKLVPSADHNSLCVRANALAALKEIWAHV
jgi:pimeloyl-ACP methyl ester carboxylesterase